MNGATEVGVFRPSNHTFYLRNTGYPSVPPTMINWGLSTDLPVTGDWNGDGRTEIGVFRPSTHTFTLDYDGDGTWNPAIDKTYNFGSTGDNPVSGKWA